MSDEHKGYQGVVADVDDSRLDRPKIRLLFDETGERIGAIDLDLREREDVQVVSVRGPEPEMEPLGSSTVSSSTQPAQEQTPVGEEEADEIEFIDAGDEEVDDDDEIEFINLDDEEDA